VALSEALDLFEETFFKPPAAPNFFNSYRDVDKRVDQPIAPAIRWAKFSSYLANFVLKPPAPWDYRFSGTLAGKGSSLRGKTERIAHSLILGANRDRR
jgi:hypothetical protein